jgi:signal transduction histidine kinase
MTDTWRILVVDDDDVDRMAVQRHLQKSSLALEVVEAQDAAAAQQRLDAEHFSCMFLDYRLPDAEGVSLIQQLRTLGFRLPIIVLTGQGDEQIAVDLMKAGASDYLAKSRLTVDVLTRAIRNAMRVYQAEQRIHDAQEQLRQTNALLRQQNQELEDQRHQIEQQNLQLLEANRLKSEFLATVTHELRTPLNSIMGFSQILQSQTKGRLNEFQATMVNRIFSNGENLLALVDDILDMSIIEAQRLTLVPHFFNLSQLVGATVRELMPLAERKGLEVQLEIGLHDDTVYNDEYRLKQVLVNLISNAIKFTDSGSVRIEVSDPAPNCIEIVVADTGIGIKSEHLSHIFKPFRQGDQTMQRNHAGTGLGLAIAHSLVSMMEGFITVDSQVGKGTRFCVRMTREILNPLAVDPSGKLQSVSALHPIHQTNDGQNSGERA